MPPATSRSSLGPTDGGHLAALWQRRQPFYPAGDSDLLTRFMVDALKAGLPWEAGVQVTPLPEPGKVDE